MSNTMTFITRLDLTFKQIRNIIDVFTKKEKRQANAVHGTSLNVTRTQHLYSLAPPSGAAMLFQKCK